MNKKAETFLKTLLEAPSPSGYEQAAAACWRDYLRDSVDELVHDVHGNSIAILNPQAEFTFMLAGHIDEIGLIVTHIDDNGYVYAAQIGGMDPAILLGQRVRILGARGEVPGVVGRKAIHQMKADERKRAAEMENIWIDIGADSRREAARHVSVGDAMVIDVPCRRLGRDKLVSRATDDKAGAFVVAEVMKALARRAPRIRVVGVATVQEEIGLRGAITSAYRVHPQAAIAVEVGHASDHPETNPRLSGDVKLGKGPVLNRGPNINPVLEKHLFAAARTHKIPVQVTAEARGTGTDANVMQLCRGGAATALVRIPNRYMHSPVEMVSLRDLDQAVKLLVAFLAVHPADRDYRP